MNQNLKLLLSNISPDNLYLLADLLQKPEKLPDIVMDVLKSVMIVMNKNTDLRTIKQTIR